MLLFTRRVGETFVIGDYIKVTILKHRNGKIKLGIDAPADIPVHRDEAFSENTLNHHQKGDK